MILQERIEELGSGILNYKNNKIYLTGFLSKERLEDYYYNNLNCAFSNGIYDYEKLDFTKIKDNSLFLIQKDDELIEKHLYKPLFKDTFKYKEDNKIISRTFQIRSSEVSKKINFQIEKQSLLFDDLISLETYLKNEYNYKLNIKEIAND